MRSSGRGLGGASISAFVDSVRGGGMVLRSGGSRSVRRGATSGVVDQGSLYPYKDNGGCGGYRKE